VPAVNHYVVTFADYQDFGIGQLIDRWIEDQKMQLDSGNSQKYPAPKTPSRLPSKP
jgi:hypothetical protein